MTEWMKFTTKLWRKKNMRYKLVQVLVESDDAEQIEAEWKKQNGPHKTLMIVDMKGLSEGNRIGEGDYILKRD